MYNSRHLACVAIVVAALFSSVQELREQYEHYNVVNSTGDDIKDDDLWNELELFFMRVEKDEQEVMEYFYNMGVHRVIG